MKKPLLLLILIANIATAQVTLEHVYHQQVALYHTDVTEWDYAFADSNGAYIFSLNHALIMTVPLKIPPGSYLAEFWSLSKNLFVANNKYEIGYYYSNGNDYQTEITDEDGTVLLQSDSTTAGNFYNTTQGTKLLLYGNGLRKVYAIPGTFYSLGIHKAGGDTTGAAFPNPTGDMIRLPYNLEQGTLGTLYVTNEMGQMIKRYQVTGAFNDLLFDASNLPAGNYFYYIEVNGSKSEAKEFVKQ